MKQMNRSRAAMTRTALSPLPSQGPATGGVVRAGRARPAQLFEMVRLVVCGLCPGGRGLDIALDRIERMP